MSLPRRIVIIEDDQAVAEMLVRCMQQFWSSAETDYRLCTTLAEAIDSLPTLEPDMIIADLYLPDSMGLETLEQLLPLCHDIPIVAMSGYITDMEGLEAIRLGAEEYIVKGNPSNMIVVISRAWIRHERRLATC